MSNTNHELKLLVQQIERSFSSLYLRHQAPFGNIHENCYFHMYVHRFTGSTIVVCLKNSAHMLSLRFINTTDREEERRTFGRSCRPRGTICCVMNQEENLYQARATAWDLFLFFTHTVLPAHTYKHLQALFNRKCSSLLSVTFTVCVS